MLQLSGGAQHLTAMLLLTWHVQIVVAPKGMSFITQSASGSSSTNQSGAHSGFNSSACGMLFSLGCLAGGAGQLRAQASRTERSRDKGSERESLSEDDGVDYVSASSFPAIVGDNELSMSDEAGDDGDDGDGSSVHDNDDATAPIPGERLKNGKLWTASEFPEGVRGPANWDLLNLKRAQEWICPCSDRPCLSKERYPRVDAIYDFRKTFQTTCKKDGGKRDAFRKRFLEPSYSSSYGTFSRSVRIGDLNDNCVAAAGLAAGLSFATYSDARTDVRKNRPFHGGRVEQRDKLESEERKLINNYILDLRTTMEGDKGGEGRRDRWHTGKRSRKCLTLR